MIFFFKNSEKCIHPALAIEEDDQPQDLKGKSELEFCFIYKNKIAWAWCFLKQYFFCIICLNVTNVFKLCQLIFWPEFWLNNSDAICKSLIGKVEKMKQRALIVFFLLFRSDFCRWHQNSSEFLEFLKKAKLNSASFTIIKLHEHDF